VAILACVMQILDQLLAAHTVVGQLLKGGGDWIAFQAWACYFLGGCCVKGGVKAFLNYFAGIAASIAIILLGTKFGGFFGVPLAVLIIVIPCISLEKTDWFGYVPALFVGAGAYFGIMGYIAPTVAAPYTGSFVAFGLVELFYCAFGLVWGWLTIVLRGAWNKKCESEIAAAK
jgi:hypothetical protein